MIECSSLISAGVLCGAISVFRSFFKRYRAGDYPPLFFRFLGRSERKSKKKRKRFSITGAVADFFLSLLFGGYLVLYDVTVLSGKGRAYHLALFLGCFFLSRWVLSHPLGSVTTALFRFVCDLIRAVFLVFTYPLRVFFALFVRFLSYLVLILKRKNDKIKRKRKAKRQIRKRREEMTTAFLPPSFRGLLGTGEKTECRIRSEGSMPRT